MTKWRTGVSAKELSAFFPFASYDQIKRCIRHVRVIINNEFTPLNIGFNIKNRYEVIETHTTTMAKVLLKADEDDVITIWDATYIYIEKSASYSFQKASFSEHKKRCLL